MKWPDAPKRGGPRTLAIDVGGSHIKASVLDSRGTMLVKRARVDTPQPCPPATLIAAVRKLTKQLPAFDRISLGFPGMLRAGVVFTAPHLGTAEWRGFDLAAGLARIFDRPARVLNDAEVQGLGIVSGVGIELVLTLGTGVGSAVFSDGRMTPHLELAQHPIRGKKTYDDYLGDGARRKVGRKDWNRRLERVIGIVSTLLNFDRLYLGGGNAIHVTLDLPPTVHRASNEAGITGCVRLWDSKVWDLSPHGVHKKPRLSRKAKLR